MIIIIIILRRPVCDPFRLPVFQYVYVTILCADSYDNNLIRRLKLFGQLVAVAPLENPLTPVTSRTRRPRLGAGARLSYDFTGSRVAYDNPKARAVQKKKNKK